MINYGIMSVRHVKIFHQLKTPDLIILSNIIISLLSLFCIQYNFTKEHFICDLRDAIYIYKLHHRICIRKPLTSQLQVNFHLLHTIRNYTCLSIFLYTIYTIIYQPLLFIGSSLYRRDQ